MTRVCKVLIGGMCIGDTFHYTPLFNQYMAEGVTDFIWWTGTFERQAVEFLCRCYPIQTKFFSVSDNPCGISDLFAFREAHQAEFDLEPADVAHTDFYASAGFTPAQFDPQHLRFRNIEQFVDPSEPPCIVVQAASRNSWKNVDSLHRIDWKTFELPVYSVGRQGESAVPGSIGLWNRPFEEIATKILSAKVVVAIHSAIACFTFYTDQPQIVCHADDCSYLRFSDFKSSALDLISPKPEEIVEAVKKVIMEGCYVS